LTCSNFSALRSKSKIPPKFGFTAGQVVQQGGEGIDAFSFHGLLAIFSWLNRTLDYTAVRGPPVRALSCNMTVAYDGPLLPTILAGLTSP
jgi:hypothetical protein